MNHYLTDAIQLILLETIDYERKHFCDDVEFETRDEWLEYLKQHLLYQYMILQNYGDMKAVAKSVEYLWNDCFNDDFSDTCECGSTKSGEKTDLCGGCRFNIKCKNCICEKCEVPIPDGKSILCGECEWSAICENCECTNNLKYWQAGDLLCEECTTQYCCVCQEGKHDCICP